MSEKGAEEAEGASEQPPRLRILSGPDKGKTHPLVRGTNEVGRALTNQVPLEGEGISKVHAVITWDDAGVVVEDMGSTNKSTLGSLEEPVELVPGHRYPMEHGDVVVFGDVACVFLWQSPGSMGGAWSRRVHTAPGDFGDKTAESSLQTPMRPQTTAFGTGDLSQQDILGQLETMMQGMSNLYSIIKGDPNSPAYTRPGSHATGFSSNFGTRAHTAADHSMGMVGESNVLADTRAHEESCVCTLGGRETGRTRNGRSFTYPAPTHTHANTHTLRWTNPQSTSQWIATTSLNTVHGGSSSPTSLSPPRAPSASVTSTVLAPTCRCARVCFHLEHTTVMAPTLGGRKGE